MAMRIYVSSEEAAFFNNNKMGYADSIPTSGSYKVGDFIISSTQLDGIFGWVCTEEGTPGKWEVIGSGAGGGKLISINASKVVDTAVNQISLAELGLAVDSKDKLIVHFNSMFLMEGVDYQITEDGSMITKLGGGNWNESNIAGCLFTFELLKNVESVNTEEVKLDSKLLCEKNNVTVNEAVSEVNIGISGFNKDNDVLTVYKNATYLMEGVDYEISADGSKIVSLNGVWNENVDADYIFTFVVFKEVVTINPDAVVGTEHLVDGSVTMDKLSGDVKQAIEDASNIDLSGYALKADVGDKTQLQTTEKGNLVGAINELFQSANNGKELIANAIGEPLVSSDTFSAMSNGINGLTSSFKTALMNNGVAVGSSDKFKQLIEKIALLADSEGKGVQIASGNTIATGRLIVDGLTFKPQAIFAYCKYNTELYRSMYMEFDGVSYCMNEALNDLHQTATCNITDNGFQLQVYNTSKEHKWYAIGVGEEDTTLLDSLKSILIDESVEVTDEDDMADLIVKTDNEFTNKNNEISSNKQALVNALNSKGITDINTFADCMNLLSDSFIIYPPFTAGTDYYFINDSTVYQLSEHNSSDKAIDIIIPKGAYGNLTFTFDYGSVPGTSDGVYQIYVKRIRDNVITDIGDFGDMKGSLAMLTASYNIDLEVGDIIRIYGTVVNANQGTFSYMHRVSNFRLSCAIKLKE